MRTSVLGIFRLHSLRVPSNKRLRPRLLIYSGSLGTKRIPQITKGHLKLPSESMDLWNIINLYNCMPRLL